jgi:hypothetical protein
MNPSEQSKLDQESINILAKAVDQAMKQNTGDQRFIDLTKIPLICLSMANISKAVERIEAMITADRTASEEQHKAFLTKDAFHVEFDTVRNIVYGGIGLILVAIVGAILSSVIIK